MTDYAALLTKITERFNTIDLQSTLALDELTLEVPAANLISVARALRDEPAFQFNLLADVCGVDYLHYGLSEWQTTSATGSGFERGRDCSELLKSNEADAQHAPDMQQLKNQLLDAAKYAEKSQLRHANPIDLPNKLDAEGIDVEMPADFTPALDEESVQLDQEPAPTKKHPTRFAVVYHLLSLPLNQRIRLRVYTSEDHLRVPSVCEIWPTANWFEREAFDLFGIIFDDHPDLRRILTDYGFIGHPFRKDFPLIGNVEVRYDAGLKRVIYEPVNISPRILEPKVIRKDNRYEQGE